MYFHLVLILAVDRCFEAAYLKLLKTVEFRIKLFFH